MPADPPDLGFVLFRLVLRSALAAVEHLAAARPDDALLAALVVDQRSIVARFEAHPEAPDSAEG